MSGKRKAREDGVCCTARRAVKQHTPCPAYLVVLESREYLVG